MYNRWMLRFAQLHCHSNFSFLEGASSVDELVVAARTRGIDALALTDTGGDIVEAYEYDPYGRHMLLLDGDSDGAVEFDSSDTRVVCGVSTVGNPYTFTGRRFDGVADPGESDLLGLHYYR